MRYTGLETASGNITVMMDKTLDKLGTGEFPAKIDRWGSSRMPGGI